MGALGDYKPDVAMLGLQFCYTVVSLLTRASLLQWMSPSVYVVYRQAMATLLIASIAYFLRDVVFHEEIFPFHTVVPSSSVLDPFPNLVLPVPASGLFHDLDSSSAPIISPEQAIASQLDVPDDVSLSPVPAMVPAPATDSDDMFLPATAVDVASPAQGVPASVADLRRSPRSVKTPHYLRDYHYNLLTGSVVTAPTTSLQSFPYCISIHISYDSLSDSH
ncbi:hypothetical protein JRO89_XS06G0138700 [Xanthoceras sorbifolium]|uniref:Uncharacterized protein n=1 Tax=Xanthoceras sorbifolium TaxID=99658 RepID=A0ABQ8HYJ2_9ROSI|nr:hypothetical protein JRO89_XS06G0138700 [Xanthoceras sorbifolium]